ncbi:pol2 [Symbiodinium natans]|uniref:Pol2 protein n=1 Tax=Symbiodinium natans TaxID=878477 RepID=A0A812UYC3_9DINO|nr:pol2 [Symbiodinium natans]
MPDTVSFESPNKNKGEWSATDELEELYEHDVPYVNRVCIDNKINVGKWYEVLRNPMATTVEDLSEQFGCRGVEGIVYV